MSIINPSEIDISLIPNAGFEFNKDSETRIDTYHVYLSPNFSLTEKDFNLPEGYTLKVQYTNRGKKNGHEWRCKHDKQKIEIGKPMIRITKREMIELPSREGGTIMPIFQSYIFGNEECCRKYLEENDIEMML